MGKITAGAVTMDKAIHHLSATSSQIHNYGRQLITQNKQDKALEFFTYNHGHFKGAWPTAVCMRRVLSAVGKYDTALKYIKIALVQAPDKLNKDGLANSIEKLKLKEDVN